MKTQHGGLSGTEDTGYNEDDMSMFIKGDTALLAIENSVHLQQALERDDFDVDQYDLMLKEHRNQVLIDHIEDS